MRTAITSFADYLVLAYHEARNVRHLVKAGHLEKAPYRLLIDGIAKNRAEAWKKLQPLREEAANAESAAKAEAVFCQSFEISLAQLTVISENPGWNGELFAAATDGR